MAKRKTGLPLKPLIPWIIVVVALALLTGYLGRKLKNSDYFKIKSIASNKPERVPDFSYLSGRNIFNIDLNKESRYISELYPENRNIRLYRILPDRLFVVFRDRSPVAYVKLYRNFFVDGELVLFEPPRGEQDQDLPVIVGLERKIAGLKRGRQYNIKELITALNIIKEIGANRSLKEYKILRIDVTNPANISCFIRLPDYQESQAAKDSGSLEVRIGQDDIRDKISVLAGLFNQRDNDIDNIRYIDLRFKEAVVKLKDAK